MLKNSRGFTLVELVVVMAIFISVLIVASSGFNTVLTQVGQQSKQMETDIGSVVGLEMFRSDLQNAGYGLPWSFQATPSSAKYTEVVSGDSGGAMAATFWSGGQSPLNYNDAGVGSGVPRAVLSGSTTFNGGAQYLVIKSLSVASSTTGTQKKSVQVAYTDSGRSTTNWGDATRDFQTVTGATERVIVLRNTFIDRIPTRQLQVNGGNFSSYFKQNQYTSLTLPHSSGDMFEVYGVDAATEPRMPFNRADYYVNRPANPPPACAPNTGVLYKAVVNQGGGFTEYPLLDCVADMQVVYGIGPAGSKEVNLHQTTLPGTGSAQDIREQLKEIRVYILAHTGRKDTSYTHPDSIINVGENFGGTLQGRAFNLATLIGTGWQNYRWKLYSIVVRPQNLIQ
ncbi:type II secretion system GspH family protein [Geomonas nitrogeniifigens]|uniref:Type II secretion system GspH family protein n=1 Tax=Geomonas diazotrophica TaxID=2843197 RepID=A0ABX8JE53_9BACT|nr:PilW family protein [Geomonas nitrogeniifigens]QWV96043.1 type II secretion system GspH family protein [Geomonas nitrogeniifigens]QXE85111.1 type II secretion system GspH family protein [Geomonas nitrogeniifigens]